MGLLADDEGNPRWRVGGIVLVLVLSVFLLPPLLRNKEISHPRSGDQQIDLCALLSEPPPPVSGANRITPRDGGTACEFKGRSNDVEMRVGLVTTRQLSAGGGAQRTSKFYETWHKEVVADGVMDMREQPGDWAMASSYRDTQSKYVLVEDRGVMLTLSSNRLDSDALTEYARTVRADLRKPPPKAEKPK